MKVNNSSIIRKLAISTLKKSAKRNIIAISAIALTTLMITNIFFVAFSFSVASDEFDNRIEGCSADFYLENLSDEQLDKITNSSSVNSTGYQIKVGSFNGQPFENKPLEIGYLDENSRRWYFAEPSIGHAPENDNEVAVDAGVLNALGIPNELGVTISLSYTNYSSTDNAGVDNTGMETADFVVVGIYDENTVGPYHYVLVSEDFAESQEHVNRTNIVCSNRNNFNSAFDNMLMEEADSVSSQIIIKEYSTDGGLTLNLDTILIIGLFLVVLGFSGYLIIYNIFQISVVNDIAYYGLLKTIGVTGKQLKRIIRVQALALSAIGIPFGLICGIVVGVITSPSIMGATMLSSVADSYSFSPWILVLSCSFSLITVFISCSKPGRIASKISPVEAFRYSEVKTDNKNNKKVSGLSGMALRNLARNKKKTALVFLSMALPIVIFSLGISMVSSMSFEKYYSSDYAFKVSNSDYFIYEIPDSINGSVSDFVSDSDIENIRDEIDFETYGSAYTTQGVPWSEDGNMSVIVGYDDNLFDSVEVIEGDITPLFDSDSNSIALTTDCDLGGNLMVGDRITINYSTYVAIDTRTGEPFADSESLGSTPPEFIDIEVTENLKEYEVCAIVEPSRDLYIGYLIVDSYSFVLPSSRLMDDTEGGCYRYLAVFDSADASKIESGDEFIKDYTEKNELEYRSATTERAAFSDFENMIKTITITVSVILGIIGILNFINAVLTGILTRSHEFAVLKAIGMTDKQQKRLLIIEGLFYTGGSIALGVMCYSLLHFPFKMVFADLAWLDPQYSLLPMTLLAIVFVLFGLVIPYVTYTVVARKSVVERLRVNE